jgi:hypothetical protein
MKPGKIEIKSPVVLKGLMGKRFSPMLIEIISDLASLHGVMITESFREKRHDNDLHGVDPVRAVDVRTWCYPEYEKNSMFQRVNDLWFYDPERPWLLVAVVHDSGAGLHAHIQVHPRTVRRC